MLPKQTANRESRLARDQPRKINTQTKLPTTVMPFKIMCFSIFAIRVHSASLNPSVQVVAQFCVFWDCVEYIYFQEVADIYRPS